MTNIQEFTADFNRRPPATDEAIAAFEKATGKQLPLEYVEFLKTTNGGEGFVGEKAYVMLWAVDELHSMNEAYEVQNYVPGLLIFGSDGGGEAFGFDTRDAFWTIVQVPFVGMDWALARPFAESFTGFLAQLQRIE